MCGHHRGSAAIQAPDAPQERSEPSAPISYDRRRTAHEVRRCKKGQRTDIKPPEWDKFGYFERGEVLERPVVYDSQTVPIPRVRSCDVDAERFHKEYASKNRPVIVEGAARHWLAMQRWSIPSLEERFRNVDFKVGKDDDGKTLRMKFKYFADYMRHQRDDSPLYLFETTLDEDASMRHMLDDFEIPAIFPHDWFGLVNHEARPPHRWFCIGPKRSGTTVHTDPLGTSAWNAVTHGRKRWVLFEPSTPRRVAKAKDVINKGEDNEAIMYFDFLLPRLKKANPEVRVYEGIQEPGDIIFVPGDWWHGVLNIEDCVAVTQNYVGPDNFETVWKRCRKEREKIAYLWLRNMRKFAPGLHRQALELNRRDGFKMRHERKKGENVAEGSSSSSESSSSDSTSDEWNDLSHEGLAGVRAATLPRATAGADEKSSKRRRVDRGEDPAAAKPAPAPEAGRA